MIKIYRKSDLQLMTTVPSNMTIEQEIALNTIPNFGGVAEDYDSIETSIEGNIHLERINGEVIAVKNEETIEEQQQAIEQQLAISDIDTLYNILKSKGILSDEDIPVPIKAKLESKAILVSQLQELQQLQEVSEV